MQALSGERLLEAWDRGQDLHELRRALLMLALATPEADPGELAALPVFERDRRLLRLRELTFGPMLEAVASCPCCAASMEFAMPVGSVVADLERRGTAHSIEWVEDGRRLRLRAATTLDLLASLGVAAIDAAEEVVLTRCLSVDDASEDAAASTRLPSVRERFDQLHAATELRCALVCPHCAHDSTLDLDVPRFLWLEVRHAARRLLEDIHALARHYGWGERDIANMSPRRRAAYLELLAS
jgi:hypothetical protein